MKRILFLIGLCFSLAVYGQGEMVTLSAGGGLNTSFFSPSLDLPLEGGKYNSDASLSGGFMVSSRYVFFFQNKNFGIGSGVDFIQYRSKSELDGRNTTPSYDEENGQAFDLIQTFSGWVEKESFYTFEFPLGFYYKVPFSEKANMVLGLGGKLVVPVVSRFEISDGSYAVSGYYPQTNVLIEDLPHHGFLNSHPVANGGIDTRLGFSVYGEVGFNFSINDKLMFHGGLYCNYGVTSILDDKKSREPSLGDDFFADTEGLFSSNVVDKVNLFSAGLKFGVTIPSNNRDHVSSGTKSKAKSIPSTQNAVE